MSEKLKWTEVNVASMPEAMQKKLNKAVEARKTAATEFKAFETDFLAKAKADRKIPTGKSLKVIIGYGGKVLVAVVEPKAAKASEGGFSF